MDICYKLSNNAIMETFDDGGLVLVLPDRRLVELNKSAVEVVKLLDGSSGVDKIAKEIARIHEFNEVRSLRKVRQDVLELCISLLNNKVVVNATQSEGDMVMDSTVNARYLCNPDVVLREEDPDEGGLLFNPDTNQVKVVNTTGLFIWQACGQKRTMNEIVAEVQKGFDEAPMDHIHQDVKEFMDDMIASGFIGTIEDMK